MGQTLSAVIGGDPWPTTPRSKADQDALAKTLKSADYLASRGADGLAALKQLTQQDSVLEGKTRAALPRGWQKQVPLHGARSASARARGDARSESSRPAGACMNAHVVSQPLETAKISITTSGKASESTSGLAPPPAAATLVRHR